jgi:hypothetical protein
MRSIYVLMLILVLGVSCNEKRNQRDRILLRTLEMATEAYREHNDGLTFRIKSLWADNNTRFQVYYELVEKVNSFANAFIDYSRSSDDIGQIKTRYLQTIDSLSKIRGPFELDKTLNKFQPVIDSTIQYFESDQQLFLQKMRFDIYRIAYSINMEVALNIYPTDFAFVRFEANVKQLDTNLKEGDKFTGLITAPRIENGSTVIIIDKVMRNGKQNLSYKLTRVESVLQIDSSLVKGNYSIEGSALFHSGWRCTSVPIKYGFKVE